MQSCCHSFARDGIWRRILLVFWFQLVSEVCVSELPLAEPRSAAEEGEITNEGTHGSTKERRYGMHMT